MKINERTLVHIAQSAENPVDQSGWLLKLNDDKKTFQRRWCVLKENILFYYEKNDDREPLGAIILEGYRVEIVENSEHFSFIIDFGDSQFGLPLKSYTFAAENHVDMERWLKSLSCASYDYLKMVVSELQHRLDELNVMKLRESIASVAVAPKNAAEDSESNSRRFNPFDSLEQEPIQAVTFLDLHEKYGRQLRNYLKLEADEEDQAIAGGQKEIANSEES